MTLNQSPKTDPEADVDHTAEYRGHYIRARILSGGDGTKTARITVHTSSPYDPLFSAMNRMVDRSPVEKWDMMVEDAADLADALENAKAWVDDKLDTTTGDKVLVVDAFADAGLRETDEDGH